MSEILKKELIAAGKFLQLENIIFKNDKNKIINWEVCQRKNNINSVSIITILIPSFEFLFVKEFRASVGTYCIGNPAGLIEQNESIKAAAIRELKEETGYSGHILYVGNSSENSAGLTGELTTHVVAVVNENSSNNKNIKQQLDNDECIELIKVSIDDLHIFISNEIKKGNIISSKLENILIGMNLYKILSDLFSKESKL